MQVLCREYTHSWMEYSAPLRSLSQKNFDSICNGIQRHSSATANSSEMRCDVKKSRLTRNISQVTLIPRISVIDT